MALPKIDLPLFDIEIPSTKKKTKFRPFTVKEEKILLIAQESKDIDQIINAIKQIVNNTVENIDVDDLATFDLEYLLVHIRGKSVSNEIQFSVTDPDTTDKVNLILNTDNVKMVYNENHNKMISLDSNVHIMMRYPSINELSTLVKNKSNIDSMLRIMISCIDQVIEGDSVYKIKDFSEEEVFEFINSFTSSHIDSIKNFFDTMPTLRCEIPYVNSKGDDKTFIIEGIESFFI
jgi:T4 bacteriophage base plate protein